MVGIAALIGINSGKDQTELAVCDFILLSMLGTALRKIGTEIAGLVGIHVGVDWTELGVCDLVLLRLRLKARFGSCDCRHLPQGESCELSAPMSSSGLKILNLPVTVGLHTTTCLCSF